MQQLGKYQLIRQLAVGGMAEVFLAKTQGVAGFEKIVALKMIHSHLATNAELIAMLVNEAKIAAQLTHPNIAQTLDLGCVDGVYFIAMELVDGIDAFNLIRASAYSGIMLPIDACALIMRDVATALDYAHCKQDDAGRPLGIIHRDVSPDNVLISHEGVVKLVDFGIAKATMRSFQSGLGTIKGKWLHMSPEQTRGEPLDATADIYSAGTVLYQLLTGRPLYDGDLDIEQLIHLIRSGAFVPPSTFRADIPPELDRIVVRAIATNRHERYRTADALAGDLQAFLHRYSPHVGAGTLAALVGVVLERAGVNPAVPRAAPAPAPPPSPGPPRRAGTLPGIGAAMASTAAPTPELQKRWPTNEASTSEVRASTDAARDTNVVRAMTDEVERETNVIPAQAFDGAERTNESPPPVAAEPPPVAVEPPRAEQPSSRAKEPRPRTSQNVIARRPKPRTQDVEPASEDQEPSKIVEIEVD